MRTSLKTSLVGLALTATAIGFRVHIAAQQETPTSASDVLRVSDNLKPVGIPALSRELLAQIEPYNRARSAVLADWEPGRRAILITTRFGSVAQLHRVAMPMGDRQQLTFAQSRVANAWANPSNPDEALVQMDEDGDEFFQLYSLVKGRPRLQRITAGGRSRNQNAKWSRDGRRLAYSSTARNGTDTDIVVADAQRPAGTRIIVEGAGETWSPAEWSPDGAQLLAVRYRSAAVNDVHLVDADSGRREHLGPGRVDAGYLNPVFAPNGKSIYAISTADGDNRTLIRLDLTNKRREVLTPALKWDIEGLAVSDTHLAYVANIDGVSTLHIVTLPDHAPVRVPALPKGVITNLRWRTGAPELAFTLSHARSPGDVYSFTVGGSQLEQWTRSETGGLDSSSFAEPELIKWPSFDGLTVSGFYYRPPARFTGPRPLVIAIHGGPESQSLPSFQGRWNYYLNELGVALILPNVRGSTGYGSAFLNADNGVKREDSVKDIGALLDWIKDRPELNPARVMVTGGSYGGYMTLATMKLYGDRIRCAFETVGISDFRTFLERTESYRRDLRRIEYGDEREPAMRAFFERIAPLNHVERFTKPMFIVAGRKDPRVSWQEGQQMFDALRTRKVPAWFLVAEDEGHGFVKQENQDYLFAASVEFARRFLLD